MSAPSIEAGEDRAKETAALPLAISLTLDQVDATGSADLRPASPS
jgi:hypothetical protein